MSKYDRSNLLGVTFTESGAQALDVLGASYARLVRNLVFQRYRRVMSDEEFDLPKISYREYQSVDQWWIIGAYNGVINPFDDVKVGTLLRIPTITSIDAYIRSLQATSRSGSEIVLN